MKVLLLTDIPPCKNFTAGLVLERLVSFLPPDQWALCSIINSTLSPEIPAELAAIPKLLLKKPREAAVRVLPHKGGSLSAASFELLQAAQVRRLLLPKIVAFAKQQQIDAVWVVLQGQTMIRLALPLVRKLGCPLFTQIWDPFNWWLRANRIDSLTQRRLLAGFDAVIRHSAACATASWAMSENYSRQYGVRNLPVIAGLPKELVRAPATAPHTEGDFIIAMAGQFYAQEEWACLIHTLNQSDWSIAGRRIRVRVMGGGFQVFSQTPANFEYLGWQSQQETIRLLAESDLLYLPYWFSEEFRGESSNSFPSKLVTYFAAGRPVFCHAPAYASPARYIVQHDAGYHCESLDPPAVLKQLERAIVDTEHYAAVAQNGSARFLRDFTLERMRETFFEFLNIEGPSSGER